MPQSLLLPGGLDAANIQMLCILGAVFMPSILGLLLAFISLWLPRDGPVLSQPRDGRQHKRHPANDNGQDWRHAA